MKYVLIATAFVIAIAAVFGDTTKAVNRRRRLTSVGWVVIAMALSAAMASIAIEVRADRERKKLEAANLQIRAVWAPQLEKALSDTRMLLRYLAVNAKLEQEEGENPIPYTESGLIQSGRIERLGIENRGPEVSQGELFDLLSEFSVNPVRFPRLAWPQPPSAGPRRYQSIDQRLSISASAILTGLDALVEQYGDVMARDKRALVEEFRTSPFLHHIAAIRHIAAAARAREESIYYPVHILQPGIDGVSRESLTRLIELLEPSK